MLLIGLTGGIASGKSTVSNCLRSLGAPVVDADAIVHQLQAPGSPVLAEIARAFGQEVIRPDGSLDRVSLGGTVFADPAMRKVLERIMHPRVKERLWAEVTQFREQGEAVTVLDVPLLIEGGLYRQVEQIWLVYVDLPTQKVRLMQRDGLTALEADRRIAAQMSLEEKRGYASLVIDNRGSKVDTERQVMAAWQEAAEQTRESW